jgi:Lipocalin-like domain
MKLTVTTVALFCLGLALPAGDAFGQTANDLAGFWTIVSADKVNQDGSEGEPAFGPNPKGFLVFDSSGHYELQIISAGLPKFSSNNRMLGTAEENKAVVQGMVAHFGKYSVNQADLTVTFHIERSSFPNWEGTEQRLPFTITGDQLNFSLATTQRGGSVEAVWKRAK